MSHFGVGWFEEFAGGSIDVFFEWDFDEFFGVSDLVAQELCCRTTLFLLIDDPFFVGRNGIIAWVHEAVGGFG